VVVITPSPTGWAIAYRGAIDNNPQVSANANMKYLENALAAIQNRRNPSPLNPPCWLQREVTLILEDRKQFPDFIHFFHFAQLFECPDQVSQHAGNDVQVGARLKKHVLRLDLQVLQVV
jgi:hypothetical protein